MSENIKNKVLPLSLLAAWLVFLVIAQTAWLKKDTLPPAWDEAHHLRLAVQYGEEWSQREFKKLFLEHDLNYPPLYHWTLALSLKLFGREPDAGGVLNILYLGLLIFSIFALLNLLTPKKENQSPYWTALTGACLISSYPFLFYISHLALIDTALTAWSAFVLLCLFKCDRFSNKRWTVLLGVGWACGMMTKWSFFAYVLFPTFWIILKSYRQQWRNVRNFLIILLAVTFPWYFPNFFYVVRRVLFSSNESGDPQIFSLEAWKWYLRALPNELGIFGLILFAIGFVRGVIKKEWFLIVSTIFLPYLFWTLTQNKDFRYFMPILPAIAVISAMWISRRALWVHFLVFFVCAFQTVYSVYAHRGSGGPLVGSLQIRLFGPMGALAPVQEDWKQKEILEKAIELREPGSRWSILRTISFGPYLSNISLRYATIQNRWYGEIKPLGNPSYDEFFSFTDFVLDQTDGWSWDTPNEYRNHEEIQNSKWFSLVFKETGRWRLPATSGNAVMYKLEPQKMKDFSLPEIKKYIETVPLDPDLKSKNVKVEIDPISQAESEKGHFRKVTLKINEAEFRDFPIGEIQGAVDNVQINLPLLKEKKLIRILKMDQLVPSVLLEADKLTSFLKKKAGKDLSDIQIKLENQRIDISAKLRNLFKARVVLYLALDEQKENLVQKIEKVQLGWITIPRFLYKHYTDREHSLLAGPGMAFDLKITTLEINQGKLKIN